MGLPDGYVAMQVDDQGLKFMAMNLGPGIATRLQEKFPALDDWQALCKACQVGVTSKGSGGLGLHQVAQFVQQTGGYLYLRSGEAGAVFGPEGKWEREASQVDSYLWGTQIGIELPRKEK